MSLVSYALFTTLILFSLSVFYFVNRTENTAWRGRQSEAARNAAGTVSAFIQRVQDSLTVVSIVEPDQLASDSNELNALLQENTALLEIIRMDSSGRVIANASHDKSVLANLITIPQSQWFLQAREGQTYTGDVQLSSNNAPYLIMAVPSAEGVVAARVQMNILWNVVTNIHFGRSGEVIVINQAGNVIAHTNPEFAVSRQTLLGRPEYSAILNTPNHEWSGAYTNFHNERVVATSAPVPGTDWIVITELPESEAFADSRTAVFVLGIEAFLLMLGASLTMIRYVRLRIVSPMEQLRDGADRIGHGELSHRIGLIRKDEIGQLATAFNSMAADLGKRQENLQKALAYEYENKRANELARSNSMILALSNVATLLEHSSNSELIMETLGIEMQKLGLSCAVVTIDLSQEAATLKYLSYNPATVQKIEKIIGFSLKDYVIPKRYWPGERILTEKIPIWYPKPQDYIRRMFPPLPEFITNQAWKMLGIQANGQICILPLLSDNQVIGAVPIWGPDLKSEDSPILAIFAGQVASILQSAFVYERETERANELARSNSMILALSKVAVSLENSSNSELVLDILGSELKGLGLDCGVVTVDPAGEAATIKYLSFNPAIIQKVEKLAGVSAKNYIIPKRYWPDDRAIKERIPIWYSNPENMLRGMFPQIPEMVAQKALHLLGFKSEMRLCMLPLINREQVLGTLIIWGVKLYPSDDAILGVFASQVAGILKNAIAHENETLRANELARTNSMILALSKVSAQLDSSSNPIEIFDAIGKELKKLGIDSIVGILDDDKQNMQIQYISINQDIIRWAEKMSGHSLSELSIPRRLWPTNKVVTEKIFYWDPNLMRGTLDMFPILPKRLHKAAMKMAGINMDDPVCYLPLANEQDVIGVLAVWGVGLKQSDTSALNILASQVATAIRNSQLYEIEVRQSREKEVLLKEIHHRVKNNLQIISSLLNLQTDQVKDTGTLRALRDSQARVRSMALIHEKLYQSKSLAKINFGEYVQSLSKDLFRSYQRTLGGIRLNIQADEIPLDLDYAVPCGLILNELITNVLKYAFPNGRNGTITIELRSNPDHNLSLRVADDGVGLPTGLNIFNAKTLGLQLVNSLVKQVDGKLEVENSNGTAFRVSFRY